MYVIVLENHCMPMIYYVMCRKEYIHNLMPMIYIILIFVVSAHKLTNKKCQWGIAPEKVKPWKNNAKSYKLIQLIFVIIQILPSITLKM